MTQKKKRNYDIKDSNKQYYLTGVLGVLDLEKKKKKIASPLSKKKRKVEVVSDLALHAAPTHPSRPVFPRPPLIIEAGSNWD